MHCRPRRARPLWLAAFIASAALAQSQPASSGVPSSDAPAKTAAPAPKAAAPAAKPAADAPPAAPKPSPQELAAEEAERERRRKEVGAIFSPDSELGAQSDRDERSLGLVAFQTFLALGIVILLVYLTLNYGVRRMMGLRPVTAGSRVRLVNVVERIPLDQKKAMYVVKAAGEYLLVGGTDGGLSLISKLDAEAVAKLQSENAAASPTPLSPFLQKLLSRRDGTPPKTG